MKQALLITFFGAQKDRFCTYQEALTVTEKLERAAQIPGVSGVEMIFPEECRESNNLADTLRRLNLQPAAINVNIKGHPRFVAGALSSSDPGIRRLAVETIAEAKEFAREIRCKRVTCAPLSDGYDYPLQLDYVSAWTHMVECLGKAAETVPEVTLHIEHKPADPRTWGLLASASKVLCLCRDIGRPNVGITFNVGHAVYGGGWPAAEFARVLEAGVPCYVHYNDGAVNWDWDIIAGSQKFWQLVEFLFYAKDSDYRGWFTADVWPLRQDAAEVFGANIRVADRIWNWLESTDLPALRESIQKGDAQKVLGEIARWVCQTPA